jgi:hypothetical protein
LYSTAQYLMFRFSKRTWKTKLKQWGCMKNVPTPTMQWVIAKRMQRIEDGKATDFFYKRRQIMPKSIRPFVGRNQGVVSLDAGGWFDAPCSSSPDNQFKQPLQTLPITPLNQILRWPSIRLRSIVRWTSLWR